jgi:hypothetical protein
VARPSLQNSLQSQPVSMLRSQFLTIFANVGQQIGVFFKTNVLHKLAAFFIEGPKLFAKIFF